MADAITFWATIAKVQTMVDSGIRIYLDLPEQAIMAAAELMACKRMGVVVDVVVTAREQDSDDTGKERKSKF